MYHFNRLPRKGIYAFSFCKKSSSAAPTGQLNLHNIRSKDLQLTLNSSAPSELIMYAEAVNVLTLDFEKNQYGQHYGKS